MEKKVGLWLLGLRCVARLFVVGFCAKRAPATNKTLTVGGKKNFKGEVVIRTIIRGWIIYSEGLGTEATRS